MVPARASIHNAYCVRRWLNPFDNARRLPISGAPISGVPQLRPFACLSSMVEGRRLCQMLCFTTRYLLICVVRVSGVVKKSRFFPPSPLTPTESRESRDPVTVTEPADDAPIPDYWDIADWNLDRYTPRLTQVFLLGRSAAINMKKGSEDGRRHATRVYGLTRFRHAHGTL